MTPDKVLEQPARVLTQQQREAYFANGYVVAERVIPEDCLARLRDANAAMVERSRALTQSDGAYVLEAGHSAATPRLKRLSSPVDHHPAYWEIASRSPIADAAADVVGPDVKFFHAKLNFKWAAGGQEFQWHQDIQAWPHTNYSPVTIGLYIDDVDAAQGPLMCVRGSHKGRLHSMYDREGKWVLRVPEEEMAKVRPEEIDVLTAPAGSLVLLHCRTVHGSKRNESPRGRPFLLNVYSSADAFAYAGNPLPSRYAGAIVRGKPALWAHHDPEPCEIPPDWTKGYVGPWAHQNRQSTDARPGGY